MDINIFQVDVFSDKSFGGNPAGVVPDATGLDQETMQAIAREMNISETAFVEKLDDELFKVRFFTPTEEVDLCGHATIGAFFTMARKHYIRPIENGVKKVEQITKAGRLPIYLDYSDYEIKKVFMVQSKPVSYGRVEDIESLAESLNIGPEDIGIEGLDLRPEIISTGLKDILIPIRTRELLNKIEMNIDKVVEISKEHDVVGYHLYTMEDISQDRVYTRNFAPKVGINEESATGTSNGALAYLLNREGIIEGQLRSYQGESLNRLSIINCSVEGEIVTVGGRARLAIDGILTI